VPLIADGGRILNVSSGLTRLTGAGYAAYAAAKRGVEVLTRYMALELGERQIRLNTPRRGRDRDRLRRRPSAATRRSTRRSWPPRRSAGWAGLASLVSSAG
jgi:NAD(P)-dependent dehydrogenase (short-subunit alcohol dehydrogenase family)